VWVASRIEGCARGFGENQSFAVNLNDRIIAGIVFHNWNPESEVIEVSCAATSPKWATRDVLNKLLEYPFSFCRMVIARMSEENTRSRRLWRALGANEYIIPDLRADGVGEAVATLTNPQWKKSRLYHGQT